MKKNLLLFLVVFCSFFTAGAYSGAWQKLDASHVPSTGKQVISPKAFIAYALNDAYLRPYLFSLNDDPNAGQQIELPEPGGGFRTYIIWKSQLMAEGLEAKYPDIRTFTAHAIDDQRVVAKIDYTTKGFHAMVFNGDNTYFIDPYSNVNDGTYMCYYKRDFIKPLHERMVCENKDQEDQQLALEREKLELASDNPFPGINAKVLHGREKRTYRLALACTYEYSVAVDGPVPTKPGVLSAMVTSVNRVTGVYEKEMAISLQLVANTDDLIWITNSSSVYTNGNGGTMLGQNQTQCTNIIGSANYDIGHVFSTGGGGIASLGCICSSNNKAQGVTGSSNPVGDSYDIDYVAHEMGHQFGGPHTFNNNSLGSCSGNRSGNNAYEPGSGSTIMAYAGICGSDDLQPHSDAYFHANSLQNIFNTITGTSKNNCPVKTITGNAPSGIPSFTQTYAIPFQTPFELIAPQAIDSLAADTLTTYCWEEYDRGAANTWPNAQATGPIFRSFNPTISRIRVFPIINKIVANVTDYVGEKVPPVARTLRFKLTVRSIYQGIGATNYSDDSIHLDVINTTTPFKVTAPNTAVTWAGGSTQTVTWDVSGTTAAPISCANVDIRLSVDGGYTYPYPVVANVPNNGSASVTVPNVPTTNQARMKVKGAGNVFFDISNTNFTINFDPSLPPALGIAQQAAANHGNDVKIFPVPASDILNITTTTTGNMNVSVYNAIGQAVWKGTMNNELQLNVKDWAKGMYYIHFNSASGTNFSKPVVIQ